jgi:hypothetical protein
MPAEQQDSTTQASPEDTNSVASSRPYERPRLVAVGNLNDILAGNGSKRPDAHSMNPTGLL